MRLEISNSALLLHSDTGYMPSLLLAWSFLFSLRENMQEKVQGAEEKFYLRCFFALKCHQQMWRRWLSVDHQRYCGHVWSRHTNNNWQQSSRCQHNFIYSLKCFNNFIVICTHVYFLLHPRWKWWWSIKMCLLLKDIWLSSSVEELSKAFFIMKVK